MIPYFVIPPLQIGPVAVQPFGILAAAGVSLASALLLRGARRRALDEAPLRDFAVWAVVAGVIGGHLVHLLFYHPEELRQGGVLQLLRVWDGLSSTGGVLGGVLIGLIAAWFSERGKKADRAGENEGARNGQESSRTPARETQV